MTSEEYLKLINATDEEIANEEWRDVPDFVGFYQASNLGRIRSVSHKIYHYAAMIIDKKGKLLCLNTFPDGYLFVSLSKNGIRKNFRVNRLILAAFYGWKDRLISLHLDDNPKNNRVKNLKWGTHKENTQDALSKKRLEYGERHHAAKITYEIVDKIFELKKTTNMTNTEIGKIFGVTKSCIQAVLAGTTWTVR